MPGRGGSGCVHRGHIGPGNSRELCACAPSRRRAPLAVAGVLSLIRALAFRWLLRFASRQHSEEVHCLLWRILSLSVGEGARR